MLGLKVAPIPTVKFLGLGDKNKRIVVPSDRIKQNGKGLG